MKNWYSAHELAEIAQGGCPGLPGTVRNITAKAAHENWPSRPRAERGGGREYPLEALPPEARSWLLEKAAVPEEPTVPDAPAPPVQPQGTAHLKDWQTERMEARLAVLRYVDHLAISYGRGGQERAIKEAVQRAKEGTLPVHIQRAVVRANLHGRTGTGKRILSRRSLLRWKADAARGDAALAPKITRMERIPAWSGPLLALYRQPQKPVLADCVRALHTPGALPEGVRPPSYDAARRFLAKVGNVEVQRGRLGKRELRNIRTFIRRDTSRLVPGDVYIGDGHTFEGEVAHPENGAPFRPELTSFLDVHTRYAVGFSLALSESAHAVLDALTQAVKSCGIPAVLYVDNGSGYNNALISDEATGVLARLGITLHNSIPYNSQARGIIERFHKTTWVRLAKTLPTYMGADMDKEAKQLAFKVTRTGRGLLPWADFLEVARRAVEHYNHQPHTGLPRITDGATGKPRHQTPAEAWQAALDEGWEPVMPEHQADLFHPQTWRTVRRGELALFGNTYFAAELEEWTGERVRVAFDIHDAERVWVRDGEGALICEAAFEANKADYMPITYLERAAGRREAGQLARLEDKEGRILDGQAARGVLPPPEAVPLTEEQKQRAAEYQARMEAPPEPEPSARPDGRPIFRGEFAERDWGRWVLATWPGVDTGERRLFLRRCVSGAFRELVGIEEETLNELAV